MSANKNGDDNTYDNNFNYNSNNSSEIRPSGLNLVFGDPLFLNPNDTCRTPLINLKLTGMDNYNIWSIAMKFSLRNKSKLGFIDGTCKRNAKLYARQMYSKTTFDMWIDLKHTYDKVDGSVIFNLHKNINSLNQNGSSLSGYYHNLNTLWKQFDAMVSLPACTCNATKHYEHHANQIKLMQFLMGLDDVYLLIRSDILTREPIPLVKTAFAVVSGE
ncbi:putative RNA-directed DNA polymerase [Tanacetum coccineum]